jgi:hypothetical protein
LEVLNRPSPSSSLRRILSDLRTGFAAPSVSDSVSGAGSFLPERLTVILIEKATLCEIADEHTGVRTNPW